MTGEARIIDGKATAAALRAEIGREVAAIKAARVIVPGLHVVLVGEDPASKVYVASKEKLAVEEANKLGIPVLAVLDSNSDPAGVTYPIPGNDDAIRAITLYCDLVAGAVLDGISAEMAASGRDVGAAEDLPPEQIPEPETEQATA